MNREATVLWHLLGEMEITGNKVIWTQDGVNCVATIEGASSLSAGEGHHSCGYNHIDTHKVLKILGTHVVSTFGWPPIAEE